METVGYGATVLTILAFVPQAVKAVMTRKTRDLALSTYILIVLSGIVWTVYGFGIHKLAIILTNSIVGLLALIIVVIKIRDQD